MRWGLVGLTISGLKNGHEYIITEVSAPTGYELDLQGDIEQTVTISSGYNNEITFENKKFGNLKILKVDDYTDKAVPYVEFKVKKGNKPNEKYLQVTDSKGNVLKDISNLEIYAKTYNDDYTQANAKASYYDKNLVNHEKNDSTKYTVKWVSSADDASTFSSNTSGEVTIYNLPIGTYTTCECGVIEGSSTDGNYIIDSASLEEKSVTLVTNSTVNNNKSKLALVNKCIFGSNSIKEALNKLETDGERADKIYKSITEKTNTVYTVSTDGESEFAYHLTTTLKSDKIDEIFKNDNSLTSYIKNIYDTVGVDYVDSTINYYCYIAKGYGSVIFYNKPVRDLTITKVDAKDDTQKIEGAKFVIKVGSQYLRVNNQNFITGTVTLSTLKIARSSVFKLVSSESEATVFVTDTNGQIKIENLDIYYRSDGSVYEYKYTPVEVSNTNYGYKASLSDIILLDGGSKVKTVTFINSSGNETNKSITITNKQKLGNLQVQKVDADNSDIVIGGIDFKVKKDSGYLKITDSDGNIINNISELTIDKKTGETTSGTVKMTSIIQDSNGAITKIEDTSTNTVYNVSTTTNANEASTFRSNSSGTFTINNLEVYGERFYIL